MNGKSLSGWLRYQYQRAAQYPHYRKELKKIEARKNGVITPQFEKLYKMRNQYAGKHCVIIADAACITAERAQQLNQEITFGVGSVLGKPEWNGWKPTYLGIQDPNAYQKLQQRLQKEQAIIFAGDNLAQPFELPAQLVQFPYLGVYKYYENKYGEMRVKFSPNAFEVVYDGYGIVYSMLQIAVYLGFEKITVLGCPLNNARQQAAYQAAKQYTDAHGIVLKYIEK